MNHTLFVLAIIAIVTFGGIARMWVRAKHGYPLEQRRGIGGRGRQRFTHGDDADAERAVQLLSSENERLVGQVSRLEERIAVLERIATDPAERTAREIEALRTRD